MRLLVVLSGLPGSGKSFFASSLPPSKDRLVVEEDAVRERLFGNGRPYSMKEIKDDLMSRDRLAALEGVLHWDKAVLLWFSTPIEVCRERNAARPAERRVPDGVFTFLSSSYQAPSKEEENRFFFVYHYPGPAL